MSLFSPWTWLVALVILGATAAASGWAGYDYADTKWLVKWNQDIADRAVATAKAEGEARAAEQTAVQQQAEERKRYEARILVSNAALADALSKLRDATKLLNRAPAASAPAECRDYDADPALLSSDDAEILFRLASRADRVVEQLTAAQREIAILRDATGQVNETEVITQ